MDRTWCHVAIRGLGLAVALAAIGGCTDDRPEMERKAAQAREKAQETARMASEAGARVFDAIGVAREVKAEFDEVYDRETDYDLVVSNDAIDDASLAEHEAKLEAMPRVEIEGLVVGYEESTELSLQGVVYTRHFRATWAKDGRKIGLSFYSRKEIDAVAFVELLGRLVPILRKHVALQRGEPG